MRGEPERHSHQRADFVQTAAAFLPFLSLFFLYASACIARLQIWYRVSACVAHRLYPLCRVHRPLYPQALSCFYLSSL